MTVRYTWASPATAIGLVLSLIALAFGASARICEGTVEIAGGGIDRFLSWLPRHCRFDAITIGHVIIGIDHATLAANRLHEHTHVRQYERWGLLFFPVYILSSLFQLVTGRHPYFDNAFEREAFAKSPSCRAAAGLLIDPISVSGKAQRESLRGYPFNPVSPNRRQ